MEDIDLLVLLILQTPADIEIYFLKSEKAKVETKYIFLEVLSHLKTANPYPISTNNCCS